MEHAGTDADAPPIENESKVLEDRVLTHDDLSRAQTQSTAAARISSDHVAGMLYAPTSAYGYPYDPHSSPGGVEYYPSLDDTPAEQR